MPRGTLVCEIAPHQADPMVERARSLGYTDALVQPDLAGRKDAIGCSEHLEHGFGLVERLLVLFPGRERMERRRAQRFGRV